VCGCGERQFEALFIRDSEIVHSGGTQLSSTANEAIVWSRNDLADFKQRNVEML